jgi:hypothetical protein
MDADQARVRQQCGQCGVWRRSVIALSVVEQHERTLDADRNAIRRCADRVERTRVQSETDAFAAALRGDVAGADDLLALIRVDAATRRDRNE